MGGDGILSFLAVWKQAGEHMITIEQARAYYRGADPIHDFQHVLRVLVLAERLAEMEGADQEVVRVAALLHDIARTEDDNRTSRFAMQVEAETDHAILAARQARHILADAPPQFVDAVAHAIEAHRFRNNVEPQTIEAKVLFDADKLDAIGAVGVARAFSYSGYLGMPLWGEVPASYSPGASGELHTPRHEFEVKLKHIKERLYTASGRKLAEARHRFMELFFEQMAAEVAGER
ncbi:MAG: HD domain-containing protein [Candidatus Hadarchaeum sp.]